MFELCFSTLLHHVYILGANISIWCVLLAFPPSVSAVTAAPNVTLLEREAGSVFTLKCTSTGSPATYVIWTKDGVVIAGGIYSTDQVLTDGVSATYANYLFVSAPPDEVTGSYSCSVVNTIGASNALTFDVRGEILHSRAL